MTHTTYIARGGWSRGRKLVPQTEYRVEVLEEFEWGHLHYSGVWISCAAVILRIEGVVDPVRMDKSVFEALEVEGGVDDA